MMISLCITSVRTEQHCLDSIVKDTGTHHNSQLSLFSFKIGSAVKGSVVELNPDGEFS